MKFVVAPLNKQSTAIALWDADMNTYNNCYLLTGPSYRALVDSGKAAQMQQLYEAITELGLTSSDITHLVCTHGHRDHVGGASLFATAVKLLPEPDFPLVSTELTAPFLPLPPTLHELELEIISLGHHTKGHVGLFHAPSSCLFTGDYITFFGESLAHYGLVTSGVPLREKMTDTIDRWLHSPAVEARYNTAAFRSGLALLAKYPSEFLCTGHGPVLEGEVAGFVKKLARL